MDENITKALSRHNTLLVSTYMLYYSIFYYPNKDKKIVSFPLKLLAIHSEIPSTPLP